MAADVPVSGPTDAARAGELVTVGLFRRGDLIVGFPACRLAEVARVLAVLPMLDCGRSCLGGVNLRGLHVPLLDLPDLAGARSGEANATPSRPAPELAAVLSVNGRMVAMGVDKVLGLVRLPAVFADGPDASCAAPDGPVRTVAVIHRGDLVNVVDPDALVGHPSVPTVPDRRAATLSLSREQRRQMIQFDVGGATLAIPAVEIDATLPRRTITRNALTGGMCLGSIDLPQRTVPVVSASALFGLGTPRMSETSEVIVVPLRSGAPVGLAVERILRIAEIDLAHAVGIPRLQGEGLLSASLVDATGSPLFLVDPGALRADPRLLDLAAVTSRQVTVVSAGRSPGPAATEPGGDATAGGAAVERRRERYLLVDAGVPLAIPICSVTRIVVAPQIVIPFDSPDPALLGLTVIDREVMPLLVPRLARFPREEIGRVLIVDTPGARAAVAVRQVLGVMTSAWRARTGGEGAAGAPTVIRAEGGSVGHAGGSLHRIIDLAAEVDALARVVPVARRSHAAA